MFYSDAVQVINSWVISFQSSAGGTVPYLGTYLTVLNMLDTALPDTVEVRLESCLFRNGGVLDFISGAHTITLCTPSNHTLAEKTLKTP